MINIGNADNNYFWFNTTCNCIITLFWIKIYIKQHEFKSVVFTVLTLGAKSCCLATFFDVFSQNKCPGLLVHFKPPPPKKKSHVSGHRSASNSVRWWAFSFCQPVKYLIHVFAVIGTRNWRLYFWLNDFTSNTWMINLSSDSTNAVPSFYSHYILLVISKNFTWCNDDGIKHPFKYFCLCTFYEIISRIIFCYIGINMNYYFLVDDTMKYAERLLFALLFFSTLFRQMLLSEIAQIASLGCKTHIYKFWEGWRNYKKGRVNFVHKSMGKSPSCLITFGCIYMCRHFAKSVNWLWGKKRLHKDGVKHS